MHEYLHILKHSLIDSLKVFVFALIIYVLLSFVEDKIKSFLNKNKKANPIMGSMVGLIPQCGISVVASDLYIKNHITMGTLLAVFFACSDEALPVLLTGNDKALYAIPLLIIKFILGFSLGYLVDSIIKNKNEEVVDNDNELSPCCTHHIENKGAINRHLVHPLLHSIKIFLYVFVVNIIFELIIHWIGGEEVINSFLQANEMLSPIISGLVGLIPNCASSILVTELFISGGLSFASLVAGLSANAGLGIVYLFKNKCSIKNAILCILILFTASVLTGYLIMLIMNLF